jgi:ATP-binding cassette subfamily B multidrug efflux pump
MALTSDAVSADRPAPVDSRALRRLLGTYVKPYRARVSVVMVLQVFQSLALLYLPTLNADIIDNGVLKGATHRILAVGGVMIAVTALQGAATVAATYLSARVAMAVGRDLRNAVFERVHGFSAREMEGIGVPSLITRTSNDVQQIQMLLLSVLALIVTAPVMAVGGILLALTQDIALAVLLVALVPVLGVIVAVLITRMRPLSGTMQVRVDAINRVLREQISGTRVTRAFVKQKFEQRRFEAANQELTDVSVRLGRVTTLLMPLVVNTVNVFSVLLVWIGGYRIANGSMQIGALTALLTYVVMIQGAVLTAAFVLMGLSRAEVCAGRVEHVLGTVPSLAVPAAPVEHLSTPGHVEFRDVSFRYPGAQDEVLKGVDLTATPGSTTAVVGSTGSGKTTLVSLICRLFDPTAGLVLVGGVDARTLSPALAARTVSLVPQHPHLFTGTVATNLRYGRPDATDEELWQALETAQAREFVEQLAGGLHAPVSQGGTNLSGGQRQRLSIARALVRRPSIFVFDDSFSALDYTTDAALRQALARDVAGVTMIIVAQRVSTIVRADRIVVLNQGRLAGIGTHDELLRRSPVYREIVQSQLGAEQADLGPVGEEQPA